jgi:hypothetical protein
MVYRVLQGHHKDGEIVFTQKPYASNSAYGGPQAGKKLSNVFNREVVIRSADYPNQP